MSGSSGLSGRYAKALYELARDSKAIPSIVKDFESIKNLFPSLDVDHRKFRKKLLSEFQHNLLEAGNDYEVQKKAYLEY